MADERDTFYESWIVEAVYNYCNSFKYDNNENDDNGGNDNNGNEDVDDNGDGKNDNDDGTVVAEVDNTLEKFDIEAQSLMSGRRHNMPSALQTAGNNKKRSQRHCRGGKASSSGGSAKRITIQMPRQFIDYANLYFWRPFKYLGDVRIFKNTNDGYMISKDLHVNLPGYKLSLIHI